MKKLNAFFESFIPDSLKSEEETYRKAKFIVVVSWILALMALIGCTRYFATHDIFDIVWNLIGAVGSITAVLIFRKTGSIPFIAHFNAMIGFVGMTVLMIVGGGLYAADGVWILTVPVWGYVLGNARIGFFWTILTLLALTGILVVHLTTHYFKPATDALPPEQIFVNLAMLTIFIVFVFARNERIRSRLMQKLSNSKKEIETKNQEITDSITYARRIQQAKLPDRAQFAQAFRESFLLFKPKDIVSGDFYFLHQHEQTVFVASADCTGHGVPGAFMSIICLEKLEDALGRSTDLSEILRQVNVSIKASLRQTASDESTRDGMDIALCALERSSNTLRYAGANRPLWLIRNGAKEMEEIKATKKAIGGFTETDQLFETHTLQLQQGDTFYIFSDGYADTFGGSSGKKLTTKKFKDLLTGMQQKNMTTQEQELDTFIESWKAGAEQVDDILVIGVRV